MSRRVNLGSWLRDISSGAAAKASLNRAQPGGSEADAGRRGRLWTLLRRGKGAEAVEG